MSRSTGRMRLGREILDRHDRKIWGTRVIYHLAVDLKSPLPEALARKYSSIASLGVSCASATTSADITSAAKTIPSVNTGKSMFLLH